MDKTKLLTTSEVAEKLGITRWRVSQLIEDGRLKSERYGRIHLIKEEDIELVKERKTGRPKKETKPS